MSKYDYQNNADLLKEADVDVQDDKMESFTSKLPIRSKIDEEFNPLIFEILQERIKQQRLNLLGD